MRRELVVALTNLIVLCSVVTANRTKLIVNESIQRKMSAGTGATTFLKMLQEGRVSIDKTLMIKEFLQINGTKVLLVTCPRKWGKTINLSMLRTFLEIRPTCNGGKTTPFRKTHTYKLFVDGEFADGIKLTSGGLAISTEKELVEKYLAQWPVISLTFDDFFSKDLDLFISKTATMIQNVFKEFTFVNALLQNIIDNLDNSTAMTKTQAQTNLKLMEKFQHQSCSNDDRVQSIKILSEILFQCFQKKVFIFVDKYHEVFYALYKHMKQYTSTKWAYSQEKAREYVKRLLKHTFVDNPHLEKGIMTGIYPIAKEEVLGDTKDVKEIFFLDDPMFRQFYGFNEYDVGSLCEHFGLNDSVRSKIRTWYGGYKYRRNSEPEIYSPWSVSSYINTAKFQEYWERETGLIRDIVGDSSISSSFYSMSNGGVLIHKLDTFAMTVKNFNDTEEIIRRFWAEEGTNSSTAMYKLLVASGYLILAHSRGQGTLLIRPNREIQLAILKQYTKGVRKILQYDPMVFPDSLAKY